METQVLKSGVYRIRKKDDEDFTYIIEKVPKLVRKGKFTSLQFSGLFFVIKLANAKKAKAPIPNN